MMNRHFVGLWLLFDLVLLMSSVIVFYQNSSSSGSHQVDREIAMAAQGLKGWNDSATVQNTLDFVNERLTYEEAYWPVGLYGIWTGGVGDCSDYSLLTVALLKANGLRARQVQGWVIMPDGTRERHAWVEVTVWVDPLWDDLRGHEKLKYGVW